MNGVSEEWLRKSSVCYQFMKVVEDIIYLTEEMAQIANNRHKDRGSARR